MKKLYYVYFMTNFSNTTFYIGVTNNLRRRVSEHKNKLVECFTSKYNLNKLVYFESTEDLEAALNREKQLKRWHRNWKVGLISEVNPEIRDLSDCLIDVE